jgi:hypothetical protein
MKAETENKREPLINKRDMSRFDEIGHQTMIDDKTVVTKLVNEKLNKEYYLTAYHSWFGIIEAYVVTPEGASYEKIPLKDIENDKDLKCAFPFKEATLSELELLPEQVGNQILFELYNWYTGKNKEEEVEEKKEEEKDVKENVDPKVQQELDEMEKCRDQEQEEQSISR